MPTTTVAVDICAGSEEIFDLIHNYSRRLEWDPFLREARLLDGAKQADVGVASRCTARNKLGGFAMDTEYVSFFRPTVAAVAMVRGPFFLRKFAASICQKPIDVNQVRVVYRYHFESKPRYIAFLVEPIVDWVFRRETQKRLNALKAFVE